MRRRPSLAGTSTCVLAAIASHGCGSHSSHWTTSLSADASGADGSEQGADGEAGTSDCGPVGPRGMQLVMSTSVAIDGVTTDGYAIYTDVSNTTLNAVPLAGGPSQQIGNVDASNAVFVSGKVVYFEPAVIPGSGNGIASLAVWTAAGGTVDLPPSAPIPASSAATGNGLADVSPDSSQILFFATQDGVTATLMVSTPDGKTQLPLLTNVDLGVSSGCRPFAQFAGLNVVASYCPTGSEPDAGAPVDAGVPPPPPDSGAPPPPPPDSGAPPPPDSGSGAPVDAGPRDAGGVRDATAPIDASSPPDASRDAAVADSSGAPRDARAADSESTGTVTNAVGSADATIADDPAADGPAADAGRRGRVVRTDTRNTPDASAGSSLATITAFSGPSFTQSVLVSNTSATFAVDPSGNHVLLLGPSGAVLYPMTGGAGAPVDSAGIAGVFTRDGANVVYVTRATALKRSPVANPVPQTLVISGLAGLFGLSPDQTWALAYRSLASGGATSDLLLAPAAMQGDARPLTVSNAAAIFGDAFTADSQYVLYFDHITPTTGSGNLYVAGVSGKASAFVASNAWSVAATSGSKAVASGNCATCSSSTTGAADLLAFDASEPSSVTTLVSRAYASFYLTGDRNKVVYSWTCSPDQRAGVYALEVP